MKKLLLLTTMIQGMILGLPLALPQAHAAEAEPITIGVLNDASGVFANDQGVGSVLAAQMAVEDVGGSVNGRKIVVIAGDHQNKPDLGSSIAHRWFDADGVQMIIDVPNSAIALDVSALARDRNKVFIGSGAGTSELTGAKCSPNTVQWTYDTWSDGHSAGTAGLREGGTKWFFITADYAFGYDLEKNTIDAVKAGGATVVGEVRAPLGTHDFSSYLLQAQSSGANILMFAWPGGPDALKQAAEFGLTKTMHVINPTLNPNMVHALGLKISEGLQGVAPFYWDLNDGTRAFSKRFQDRFGAHRPPNDMQAGVYSAILHYLKAIKAGASPEDGRAVVAEMKKLPVEDAIFGKGYVRADGREMHPLYLLTAKSPAESKSEWDLFTVSQTLSAEEAYRPLAEGQCPMVTQK